MIMDKEVVTGKHDNESCLLLLHFCLQWRRGTEFNNKLNFTGYILVQYK